MRQTMRLCSPNSTSDRRRALPASAAALACVLAVVFVLAGCRQDMHDQPRYKPLRPSSFFADGRSSRPLVEGTVPRGYLRQDTLYYTGKVGNQLTNEFPFPITVAVLHRGEERFNIYCSPCHSRLGDGNGMIARRGYRHPPSFHTDALRRAPVGHFYDVMTNGWGSMPDYAEQVTPQDRWAIAAYIRALQYSENAPASDVPPDQRSHIEEAPPMPPNVAPSKSGMHQAQVPTEPPPVPLQPQEQLPQKEKGPGQR